jgi:predicted SAM-dependent methyltransferase
VKPARLLAPTRIGPVCRQVMKLHIGCGKRDFGPDWVHVDGSDCDHVKSHDVINLPCEDGTADVIYASHVLEYFDRDQVPDVLQKWSAKLKPSGVLRLAVPDFSVYAEMYVAGRISLDQCLGPLYGKWQMSETATIYHKTTYDFPSLKKVLKDAGFAEVVTWDWRKVEHGKHDDHSQSYLPHMDKENGRLMSLNVECRKASRASPL